jgi:hypothetical protein
VRRPVLARVRRGRPRFAAHHEAHELERRVRREEGLPQELQHAHAVLEPRREAAEDSLVELGARDVPENVPRLELGIARGPQRRGCAVDRDEAPDAAA